MRPDDPLTSLPPRFRALASWLRGFAEGTPDVVAGYLGGSLATDRVDEDSDLDGQLMVRPGLMAPVFAALRASLESTWSTAHLWVVPTPTWHGGLQLFATAAAPGREPVWVDLVVAEAGPRWLEVDERRHGRVRVLHDPDGLVRFVPEDDETLTRAARESAARIAERLPTAEWLVMKGVRRGHWPEAYAYHLRLGVDPVVQLLRTLHAPARWDFGLRYLDDLPPEDAARVHRLLPGPPERLAAQVAECFAWQRDLLSRLGLAVP